MFWIFTLSKKSNNASPEVQQAWDNNKSNLFGLYTGNDVVENSLATLTAYAMLADMFPTSATYLNSIKNKYARLNDLEKSLH